MIENIGYGLMLLSVLILLVASLGLFRFSRGVQKIHALGVASCLGGLVMVFGVILSFGWHWSFLAVLAGFLVLNPFVSTQLALLYSGRLMLIEKPPRDKE